jgi:hypothetical protein
MSHEVARQVGIPKKGVAFKFLSGEVEDVFVAATIGDIIIWREENLSEP